MKAIIGLGNPGPEYVGTRHNVGAAVVEELARRWGVSLKPWKRVADVALLGGRDVLLATPRTFMNASGDAVQALMAYYKVQPGDVLIVVDEVQLPLGRVRLRAAGSAGGHNGVKSVIARVGMDFPRLRIGVERGDPRRDLRDRVLSVFAPDERSAAERAVIRAADAAEVFATDGLQSAMNRFNSTEDVTTGEHAPETR
jgi:PTH1 family peptidyl-tRNA hydrolase